MMLCLARDYSLYARSWKSLCKEMEKHKRKHEQSTQYQPRPDTQKGKINPRRNWRNSRIFDNLGTHSKTQLY